MFVLGRDGGGWLKLTGMDLLKLPATGICCSMLSSFLRLVLPPMTPMVMMLLLPLFELLLLLLTVLIEEFCVTNGGSTFSGCWTGVTELIILEMVDAIIAFPDKASDRSNFCFSQ